MNAIKRYALSVVLVVWTVLGLIVASHASEQRTALVIGNAQYGYGPLANPVNDALAIARALDKAGFEVILQTDANRDAMEQAIRAFGDRLKKEGGVGLFYYAGHGIQIKGENYLLPVAGDAPADEVLQQQSVAVSEAVEVMTSSHDGLNIVVLDACRNNPLGGASSGLSRIDTTRACSSHIRRHLAPWLWTGRAATAPSPSIWPAPSRPRRSIWKKPSSAR